MELFRVTQKQTHTLLNTPPSVKNSPTIAKTSALLPKAGFLITGITTLVAAAAATVAFATDHDPSLSHFQLTKSTASQGDATASESSTSTIHSNITIDGSQPSTSSASVAPESTPGSTTDGSITINNEVLPATEGTTSRTFVDEQGAIHSVTVTIDNQSYGTSSSSSYTDIVIDSSSSSNSDNNTRGSPRR